MWQMVGILAELERSLIHEHTQADRTAVVARGVKMGRKLKLSPQQVAHASKLTEQGERSNTVATIAQRLAADAVSGIAGLGVTALHRAGPAYGIRSP